MNGWPLRFGIPSLDRLLGDRSERHGNEPDKPVDQSNFGFAHSRTAGTSFCLIGPHGAGKSVLALHFASRYFADCERPGQIVPKIFYVSTDLSHGMAQTVWQNFALDRPETHNVPFGEPYRNEMQGKGPVVEERLNLVRRTPYPEKKRGRREADQSADASLAAFLAGCTGADVPCREVTFVDLAATSAGDDWGFIHRLIAMLEVPEGRNPRHLVIVDAIEGLETLVGERDAFGEITSRRARIAQMLRTAFKKCHLFFVVEEPIEGHRVPEEFVSDVVIRLRSVHSRGYDRRTIEVQKVRGRGHIRGQHPYVIRPGVGSFTGKKENLDDPVVVNEGQSWQCYVHVMHSLHYSTRNIMLVIGPPRPDPNKGFADFGVTHLDGMLGRNDRGEKGLPYSTVTALIGDAGTHKSALGKAFLYKGIYEEIVKSPDDKGKVEGNPAVILLTTGDVDSHGLARKFLRWAWLESWKQPFAAAPAWAKGYSTLAEFERSTAFESKVGILVEGNIICRRLEIHDQVPEMLIHVIQCAVVEAQRKTRKGLDKEDSTCRYRSSQKIRLVIDDFSILRRMYPAIREDSLFLPFLIFYLKREGISTLVIDTNPGRPDREGPALFDDELRALADNHLYTWRVSFHGESRIAISAIPPIQASERSRIRELRCDEVQDLLPLVDRTFELYTRLEQATPEPIPLEVRLYTETSLFTDYIDEMNRILSDFFVPLKREFSNSPARLVAGVNPNEYAYLHDFCNLQSEHALDHTLILAVDESWAIRFPHRSSRAADTLPPHPLRSEIEYLDAELDILENEPRQMFRGLRNFLPDEVTADPTGQSRRKESSRGKRASYFHLPGCDLTDNKAPRTEANNIDRVPFVWDFGFLLCRKRAWDEAAKEKVKLGILSKTVQEIRASLPGGDPECYKDDSEVLEPTNKERATWREFLGACQAVSRRLSYGQATGVPFDISTATAETFSCLILEMWASEIVDRFRKAQNGQNDAMKFIMSLSSNWWTRPDKNWRMGLIEALSDIKFVIDFYMVWLLLVDLLPLGELANPDRPTEVVQRSASPTAVASRQWYTTACQSTAQSPDPPDPEPMLALGLPGHFSTRGDWFLGVARGSKSDLLADRVLDIFSSRRNNLTRLYSGLGLPTRILGKDNMDAEDTEKGTRRLLTALAWKEDSGKLHRVRYGDLLAFGAPDHKFDTLDETVRSFHWLFRSSLINYHKHSRIFHRWNSRTILMWSEDKNQYSRDWISGFEIYDCLSQDPKPQTESQMAERVETKIERKRNTWTHFRERCKILRNLLVQSDKTEPVWN